MGVLLEKDMQSTCPIGTFRGIQVGLGVFLVVSGCRVCMPTPTSAGGIAFWMSKTYRLACTQNDSISG